MKQNAKESIHCLLFIVYFLADLLKNLETLLTILVQLEPKESANEVSKKIECIHEEKVA